MKSNELYITELYKRIINLEEENKKLSEQVSLANNVIRRICQHSKGIDIDSVIDFITDSVIIVAPKYEDESLSDLLFISCNKTFYKHFPSITEIQHQNSVFEFFKTNFIHVSEQLANLNENECKIIEEFKTNDHDICFRIIILNIKNQFIIVFEDISQQKKAEKSFAFLQLLLDSVPSPVFYKNAEGKYLLCNKSYSNLVIGMEPSSIIGKTAHELANIFPKELADFYLEKDLELLRKKEIQHYEGIVPCADGQLREFLVNKTLIRDSNNDIIGILGVMQNIHEQKLFERELLIAKLKAEESDRLKTIFLSNLSHEIRTPMNAILGFSQLLKNTGITNKQNEYIELVNSGCKNLFSIINDIVEISMIEANQFKMRHEQFDVNKMLMELYSTSLVLRSELLKKDILILTPILIDTKYSRIISDYIRISQVIAKLIKNALIFTDQGHIEFGCSIEKNNFLRFFISDTGIGIHPEKQSVIFERFRQGDEGSTRKYGGAGLGLAIAKSVVELLNGRIWLKSELGKGSTFYFEIPFEYVNYSLKIEKETKAGKENQKPLILIVEDDLNSALYYKELLSEMTDKILTAHNGADAIEVCKQYPEIDIVIMDIQMPVMNGYEATEKIKKIRNKLPVIAQTAYAMTEDKMKCMNYGFDDYIEKPINSETLLSKVKLLLNFEPS